LHIIQKNGDEMFLIRILLLAIAVALPVTAWSQTRVDSPQIIFFPFNPSAFRTRRLAATPVFHSAAIPADAAAGPPGIDACCGNASHPVSHAILAVASTSGFDCACRGKASAFCFGQLHLPRMPPQLLPPLQLRILASLQQRAGMPKSEPSRSRQAHLQPPCPPSLRLTATLRKTFSARAFRCRSGWCSAGFTARARHCGLSGTRNAEIEPDANAGTPATPAHLEKPETLSQTEIKRKEAACQQETGFRQAPQALLERRAT
jgi:hypothetical protein